MPDPASEDVVVFRLGQLEQRFDAFSTHVDHRLDAIQGSIGSLSFVRRDVYDADQRRIEDRIATAIERSEAARAVANWCIGITLTTITLVGALAAILRLVAG